MKKYIYIGIVVLIIGLITTLSITLNSLRYAKQEVKRHEKNERVLQSDMGVIRGKNGVLAVQVESQTQTLSEFKKYNTELEKKLKNLNIRPKDTQSATTIETSSNLVINVPLRDSTILPEVKSRVFTYNDSWNSVFGVVYKNSITANIQSRDSLYIFHHLQKYKFLFIRWGVKAEWYTAENANPSNKIIGFKVKEIKH